MEFIEPSEARKAFTRLAYSKFKHLPLYLEWAPDESFATPPPKSSKVETDVSQSESRNGAANAKTADKAEEKSEKKDESKNSDDEDEDEPEPDTTLFIKNLNFRTTEEQLKKVRFNRTSHY